MGRPHTPEPAPNAETREQRRRRRLLQELAVRSLIAVLVLVFDEVFRVGTGRDADQAIHVLALVSLGLNVLYYLAAETGRWVRAQAYTRMLVDIGLITAWLASGGGLAAAPYITIYAIVPLYVSLVFSSAAGIVASVVATLAYLAVAVLQEAGWLVLSAPPSADAWPIAAFNLVMLNVVGGLTALLAEAYRRSVLRLAALNRDLERAHDSAQRLNAEIRRGTQLGVLGDVVAGITHELGNVLTVASGYLGLARRRASGQSPEIEQHLVQVEQSFEAAMRIIRNTLQTARNAGTRTAVALPEVARRILELKDYELRREGVIVRVDFPERFPLVSAAPFQLQQVLLNLILNAQQALRETPEPRVLEIVGRAGQGQVIVEIRDTGPGLAPEALPRVFEPFFTTRKDGNGLGLAIVAGIVHGLGGEITAENRPGRGALFRMTLPVEIAADAPGSSPATVGDTAAR
jgi:signal transduction histidine kinase